MAETQVLGWGTANAPNSRTTHGTEQFLLLQIEADFDGTGAATSWVPAVQIISDAGQSVGVYPADSTLAIGDTATVTFAPFLGRGGGIKFGKINQGNWLEVLTSGTGPTATGIYMEATDAVTLRSDGGAFNINSTGAGGMSVSSTGAMSISTSGATLTVSSGGGNMTIDSGFTTETMTLNTAKLSCSNGELGFFGVATVPQQATPVVLADVINLLKAYGLCP